MRRKLNTWHGYPLSPLAVKSGFIDYYTVAEVTGAEPYDIYASEEGDWELVNGDDMYFYDTDGNVYDSEMAWERVQELETMIASSKGQDTSRWKADIKLLTTHGEVRGVCDYFQITEEGARILKDESKELVYYNKELDVYVLGVCHCGISWRLVCSSIPV